MIQKSEIQMSLYRTRLLLEEGRADDALQALQKIQEEIEKVQVNDARQQSDIAYLLGWCYIQCKQWDDAIQALSPLLDETNNEGDQETLLERERLAVYLLHLGVAAVRLAHYEDAALHFTLCLKVLHNRRVHLPLVRVKARYSLALTCIQRGMYLVAVQHYEEALRLCRHYNQEEELPNIYYGLCDAYRYAGDFVKAYTVGQDALRLYEQAQNRKLAAQTHNLLGRICFLLGDFREASDHYTESLAMATGYNAPTMAMINCSALAEVRMAEGRLEEAKRYCQLALENMRGSKDAHMSGRAYNVIGRVTITEARNADGAQRLTLLEEAAEWFEKAREQLLLTQAYVDIAEVCGARAQTLEELGREQDALECWRSAYEVLARTNVSQWL